MSSFGYRQVGTDQNKPLYLIGIFIDLIILNTYTIVHDSVSNETRLPYLLLLDPYKKYLLNFFC